MARANKRANTQNTQAAGRKNKNFVHKSTRRETLVLLATVFVLGVCTLVYELLIGSVSSYFMGDSVKQFSLTIGFSLTAMGVGTLLSRFITRHLIASLILVEIALGVFGGLSVPALFWAFASTDLYYPIMILFIFITGILIGMELPLLARIMEKHFPLRQNISNVLSLDYFSAFFGALLFPFVLLPFLGLFQASLYTGLCNIAVGGFNLWYFRRKLGFSRARLPLLLALGSTALLLLGLIIAERDLTYHWENKVYADRVVYAEQTPYQKMVITKNKSDVRLFLDGNLQFSSTDEYRYHEPLAHIPAAVHLANTPSTALSQALILGGGDGLLARELLKYPQLLRIVLVDLDPAMTSLARTNPLLTHANGNSLKDARVQIINADAFHYLQQSTDSFDLIIADLPDPRNLSLARLYSKAFFHAVRRRLSRDGVFATQATSPYFAPQAFWSIVSTVESVFERAWPYHSYLASFGLWGFVVAGHASATEPSDASIAVPTRFIDNESLDRLFVFPKDLKPRIPIKSNTLTDPVLIDYYLDGWSRHN